MALMSCVAAGTCYFVKVGNKTFKVAL